MKTLAGSCSAGFGAELGPRFLDQQDFVGAFERVEIAVPARQHFGGFRGEGLRRQDDAERRRCDGRTLAWFGHALVLWVRRRLAARSHDDIGRSLPAMHVIGRPQHFLERSVRQMLRPFRRAFLRHHEIYRERPDRPTIADFPIRESCPPAGRHDASADASRAKEDDGALRGRADFFGHRASMARLSPRPAGTRRCRSASADEINVPAKQATKPLWMNEFARFEPTFPA